VNAKESEGIRRTGAAWSHRFAAVIVEYPQGL
jgi:hypothetical protein